MDIVFEKGIKHTAHGLNFYMSYFDDIARLLPRDELCFVVGGWVRDRLLGEPVGYKIDVDLLVTCDPRKIARDLAEAIGGTYFEFEKKGLLRRPTVATVILEIPPYRYRFDFSQIKGKDIEKALVEDLLSRDFTANAMAVSLDDVLSIGAKQTIIYDPAHGVEDLEMGVLRPVSIKNLEEDPVRILRGVRLSVEKDLELTEDFYQFVLHKKHIIRKASPERITVELLRILELPKSARALREMYRLGLLQELFPEIARWKEVTTSHYSLEKHMDLLWEEMDKVVEEKEKFLHAELLSQIGSKKFLGEFSDLAALKLAAIFHDIAKPHTFQMKDGKPTFYQHDQLGALLVKEYGKAYRWGEDLTRFVADLVTYHLRVFYLKESLKKGELTDRGRGKFWKECGHIAPWLFLHSIADARASHDSEEELHHLMETIHDLTHYAMRSKTKPIKPLLTGHDIMELLSIPPGPLVGEIKRALEEAQLEGKVSTREEAIDFVKNYLRNSNLMGEPS